MPPPTIHTWTDTTLDPLRSQGDPLADETVRMIYETGKLTNINQLLRQLYQNDNLYDVPSLDLLSDYLQASAQLPAWASQEQIDLAYQVFWEHGIHMTTFLFFAGLPLSYLSEKGAEVLQKTYRLSHNPHRRIAETGQMLLDVMEVDSLHPDKKGLITLQKVRLLHAAVRYLLTINDDWDSDYYGVPINQEDLLGTLMIFSYMTLERLPRLGSQLPEDKQLAYLHTWNVFGYLLGIQEDLLPATLEDAKNLTYAIIARHFRPNQTATDLTRILTEFIQGNLPRPIPPTIVPAIMRHLMDDEWADMAEIPASNWQSFLNLFQWTSTTLFNLENRIDFAQQISQRWVRNILNSTLAHQQQGQRATFSLPTHLTRSWKLNSPDISGEGKIDQTN